MNGVSRGYRNKHYLQKWHIKYNPDAEKLAQEEGYETWWQAFKAHAQPSD
ncbi:MAG: hypothetical protein GY801_39250 [bacterium]|nr:hypothetical protein [bacterium]